MNLDVTAIRNLELVRNMTDGSKRGTLLQVLDFTNTSMGARRLRSWIESPLLDVGRIYERQEAVAELAAAAELREAIVAQLKAVADLERIVSRIEVGSANARDLVALRNSLSVLPGLKGILEGCGSGLLRKLWKGLHLHEELAARLQQAIVDEPPFSVREGGMIRTGYNQELDELHLIAADNKTWMQNFEQKIKEETGIKTMKVGFNKVFGYYIEVSKGQSSSVPPYFVRKQTLVNAERYIVPELKEFENKILGAKEKIEQLEYYLFDELRTLIRGKIKEIQETARAVSYIDVLTGLAEAAYKYNYVRPELNNNGEIKIVDGRHPVVERLLEKEIFVPNNTNLNNTDERMIIITGPNMAGKSTYMRQVALLVLMIAVVALYPAFPKDALQAQGGGERPHSILYILKSSRPFTLTLVSLFFTLAAIMPIVSFMVNLVSDRGGDEGHLGLALFLMGASELPAALLFTPLFRRFGAAGTLRMSICFMAVKPLLFLLAPGLSGLLLVQPVQLLGYGLFPPASVYYANANVSPVDQVKGQSIMMIASNGLGAMFGNFLAGYAIDWGGADAMLGMCLVFGVIGVLFMLAAGRSKT